MSIANKVKIHTLSYNLKYGILENSYDLYNMPEDYTNVSIEDHTIVIDHYDEDLARELLKKTASDMLDNLTKLINYLEKA